MNDQELRELVRGSIARHLGGGVDRAETAGATTDATHAVSHASHLRLPLASGDDDGACVIEPSVRCNHCGYCLSMGH
jgi:hypothetical protein